MVGEPEGFRLLDVSLLDEFLQTQVVCRQCAEAALQDQLRQFSDYCTTRGIAHMGEHLRAYLHNLSRGATQRASVGLCGVKLVREKLEGGAQSTFTVECAEHQRAHELRYRKARRGEELPPMELVTSATLLGKTKTSKIAGRATSM